MVSIRRYEHRAAAVVAVLIMSTGLIGCEQKAASTPATDEASLVFRDAMGREIQLDQPATRIATTASFVVELLAELDRLPVLRPDIEGEPVPVKAEQVPAWAISHMVGPNLEQLVAAKPDLVITTPMFDRYTPTIQQQLNVPVVVLAIQNLNDLGPTAELLGKITGVPEQGRKLSADLMATVKQVSAPTVDTAPRVFAIFGTPDSSFAFLPESYFGSLVGHLGGELITAGAEPAMMSPQFTPLSLEFVLEHDPDVICIVRHGPPSQDFNDLTMHPAWQRLTAVKQDRVHVLSHREYVTNPGPSAEAALKQLRALLYPEALDA